MSGLALTVGGIIYQYCSTKTSRSFGTAFGLHAASLMHMDMRFPCGMPEGKAVPLLPQGTTSLLAFIYASAFFY